jgi:hypothetical protein
MFNESYEFRYRSTVLDLDARWMRVVSFTPQGFYCREKKKNTGTQWTVAWVGPRSRPGQTPKQNPNSVTCVRQRTIPTEGPSLIGEVNANTGVGLDTVEERKISPCR